MAIPREEFRQRSSASAVEAGGVIGIEGVEFKADFGALGDLGELHPSVSHQRPPGVPEAAHRRLGRARLLRACSVPPISMNRALVSPPLIARWMKPRPRRPSIET